MDEIEIRPTLKFVYAGALVIAVLVLAAWTAFVFEVLPTGIWAPAAFTFLLLWPFARWVRVQSNLTVLGADRIRSESGILSKSTRNLMLTRVQDVGVEQSLGQRIFNVGNVWIETAGASGRVQLLNIDAPKRVADEILERARHAV